MNHRPITEDDLHAYVDRVLEPERQAEVAAYLDDHPDVAKRVAAFTDQRDLLRAALAPIAEEPLPPELNLSRIIEQQTRRPSVLQWAIAAMLLLSVGGISGWICTARCRLRRLDWLRSLRRPPLRITSMHRTGSGRSSFAPQIPPNSWNGSPAGCIER